jgi:hypothetical protein
MKWHPKTTMPIKRSIMLCSAVYSNEMPPSVAMTAATTTSTTTTTTTTSVQMSVCLFVCVGRLYVIFLLARAFYIICVLVLRCVIRNR